MEHVDAWVCVIPYNHTSRRTLSQRMEMAEEKHDRYILLDFLIFTFFYD